MLAERPKIEQAVQTVFAREGFRVTRMPEEHAGGKWSLRYENAFGRSSNLEVDINFMFRVPLWPAAIRDSYPVGAWRATEIPLLDPHELAAGKLVALLARQQARDLFDSHRILRMDSLDSSRLRLGFVVYGAMCRKDWRTVAADGLDLDAIDVARQLAPTLLANATEVRANAREYGMRLVEECRAGLSALLPFTDSEKTFLDLILDRGVIDATLLTADVSLQQRIQTQPLLEWKAINVRRHRG
jgi:hypothetical protein